MNDDFRELESKLNTITINRDMGKFKLNQIKIKTYWNYDDIEAGQPISTSIELDSKFDYSIGKIVWEKNIEHSYLNFKNYKLVDKNSHSMSLENSDIIISNIEKIDLRNLKNNYFTDKNPDNLRYWEITYNRHFKIVGTYDQEIDEFMKISEILNFKTVIDEEINKVNEQLETASNEISD